MEESVVFTFLFQTHRNPTTVLSALGHVISERHWKGTFGFNEIINNYGLKRGTICQIFRFISHFPLHKCIEVPIPPLTHFSPVSHFYNP